MNLLLLTSIRSYFKDDKPAIQAQAVQDGRGGHRVEDLVPLGGDEVGGDDSRSDFRAFGDNLEDAVGLLLGRKNRG